MKKTIKFLSVVLSFLIVMQSIPISSAITEGTFLEKSVGDFSAISEANGNTDSKKEEREKAYIIAEQEDRREESVKHFRMSDGTYKAVVYSSPVHEMKNGKWTEIDRSIQLNDTAQRDSEKYIAKISDTEIYFNDNINSEKSVKIRKNGNDISFGYISNGISLFSSSEIINQANEKKDHLEGEDDKLRLKNGVLRYNNVSSSIDIEYELTSSVLKESIIISSKQKEYEYKFTFDIGELTPVSNEDGSISLVDKSNNNSIEYIIEAPYMLDNKGEFSDNVVMSLSPSGDKYILTVTADKEWLNSQDREFPVILDPTLLFRPDRIDNIFDTYTDNQEPGSNFYTLSYGVIGHNSLGTCRMYLKLNMPQLPHCGVISHAELVLHQIDYDLGSGNNYIEVYESPSNTNYKTLTWNNQPDLSNQPIIDYTGFSSSSIYSFDITTVAKKWHENEVTNNGLFLKASDENSTFRSRVYTSNKEYGYPELVISYIDNAGIEDYWSYETLDLGRSGAVYINENSGLLTYVHQDINLGGNITSLSAAHIYSPKNNTTPYGKGFRLSAQECITAVTNTELTEEGYCYYLTDSDGTAHYFRKNSDNVIHYEFDESLVLNTVTGQTYKYELQYEDSSKKQFDASGRLIAIIDRNGNKITQKYDSEGKLTEISDILGRKASFSYSGGYLTRMTDDKGRLTNYAYSNGYLSTITYPDGKTTQFTYSNGNLSAIKQTDQSSVTFAYLAKGRVSSITVKGTDNASVLKTISLDYRGVNTVITDSQGREITVGFDNMGRAVSYTDAEGNISSVKYNSAGNVNNKISECSDIFAYTENMLHNHSFENEASYWYVWQPSGTSSYTFSSGNTYIGQKGLNTVLSSQGRIVAFQDYYGIEAGAEYTFSAYVKVLSLDSANVFLRIEGKSTGTVSTSESVRISAAENEWVRIQTSYKVPSNAEYLRLCLEVSGKAGSAVFDCAQLECNASAGHYNLLTNSSFELNSSDSFSYWQSSGTVTAANGINSNTAAAIHGTPSGNARLVQTVMIGSSDRDRTVIFGGKVKGNCAAASNSDGSSAKFSILAEVYAGNEYKGGKTAEYNAYATDTLQAISESITADPTVTRIVFYLLYDKNVNVSYFDDVFVYIDNFGAKYEYYDNGKLKKQSNDAGDAISYTYTGADITKISVTKYGNEKDSCTYTYDNNHNILTETTKDGIITEYTYPSTNRGMPTSVKVKNSDGSLKSSLTYTNVLWDNYTTKITDARGYSEEYWYDTDRDLLLSYTDANGNETIYEYDNDNDELTGVYTTVGSETVAVDYYQDAYGRLSEIYQEDVSYKFTYDNFGRRTATRVGNQTLASYTYNSRGLLDSTTYGNGTVYSLTYDSSDRIISEAYNGTTAATYSYNTEGYLGKTVDHGLGITTYYGYDLVGRVTDVDSSDGVFSDFTYNEYNSISGYSVKKNNTVISSAEYTYKTNGALQKVRLVNEFSSPSFEYVYDSLNRITKKKHIISGDSLNTQYTYLSGNASNATGLIEKITYSDMGYAYMPELSYTYDAKGNILTVSKSGAVQIRYTYDETDRLIREDNKDLNQSITYTYDGRGNILYKRIYAYTTEDLGAVTDTIAYSYDSIWKDKLISYDGESISYDSIGNPTAYRGSTLTWQKGRQLASITTGSSLVNFKYNIDGLRTEKKVGTKTYSYIWSSGLLMQQSDGTNTLNFSYAPDGSPLGVLFNGVSYYYIYNLQGDVIGLYNYVGSVVVKYTYDSWGKLISTTGSLADTLGYYNPFRYRGYIYDEETGFYYVSSRYYDPEIGRFINADDIDYLGADGSPLSYNLFAYCMNNPVNRFDVNGNWSLPNWAKVTIGAVAIAGLAVATVCTGGAAAVICGAALSGAIAGGASGAVTGAIGGGISGGWQGALDGACSGFMSGTLIGGVTGAASAGLNIATGATTVVGNAHGSTLHKLATNMEAGKMAASGQYSQIGVNKALKTMGLNGTSRPDVIGVAKNGMNKIVEVVSPRQSTNYIINKMSNMLSNNPGTVGKIVNWVRRLFK